jgi:hypothetical protein
VLDLDDGEQHPFEPSTPAGGFPSWGKKAHTPTGGSARGATVASG